jgi:hypothetical protein
MPFDPRTPNSIRAGAPRQRFDWNRDFQFAPVRVLNAAENVFFERELRHLIPGMFMREYAKINARTIFPVYFMNDPGAETVSYRQGDETGEAEIVSNYADDAPNAEVFTTEHDSKIRSVRASAMWNIQEIRAAARAGVPLEQRKTNAARDAMLRKENRIAFFGDANYGLKGLFSDTDIPREDATQTFAAGTADENLEELHELANDIPATTEDIETPDTLLLAPVSYDRLATQMLGDNRDKSVLEVFLRTSPHIRTVVRVRELAGAGTGGVDVAIAFRRDIDKMRLVVALDVEQFPPERRGMAISVTYHMRVGGLIINRPKSIRIMETV